MQQDESRECARCGDVVTTLSTDNLCDGCVAEDSMSLADRVADVLNGEWPNCFNDGFQDAVAQVAAEAMLDAPLALRAPEISELLARNGRGEISAADVCQELSDRLAAAPAA